jgi:DNA-binding transcriptional LysR family regulator
MNIKHLEQFLVIAAQGSFGAASRQFGLSQPAITRNMKTLEEVMGAALFERSTRGVVLTAEGKRLLPIARGIVDDLERAREVVTGVSPMGPRLSIGLSPSLMWEVLPQTLDVLLASYPDIDVTIATGTQEWLETALETGEIDIALELTLSAASAAIRNRDMIMEQLAQVVCVPFAPAGHKVLDGPLTLERLAEAHWCMPLKMSLSYRFQSVFLRAGLRLPVQSINIASMGFVKEAMIRWNLLTILPPELLIAEMAAGRVVQLDVPALRFGFDVCALTMGGRARREVVEACVAAMKAVGQAERRAALQV